MASRARWFFSFAVLGLFLLLLALASLFPASLPESARGFVALHFRLPRLVAAVFGGAALAASGLAMQSVFANPLAGPFVLGVSSGASLGVALVALAGLPLGAVGVLPAAAVGAFAAISVVFACSRFFSSSAALLVVGLMVGYLADACVSVLVFLSDGEALRRFMTWGMGTFSRLTLGELPVFACAILAGLVPLALSATYLNLAPMGEEFVVDHGYNAKAYRRVCLLAASFLAAVVTAFCGPIAFLGLAVPHLAFGIFKTSDHAVLLPASALIGADLSLLASLFPAVPLQTFMSIVGAPVVLFVVVRLRIQR